MIILKKYQLVETSVKILGHLWLSGGFWAANITRLEVLARISDALLQYMKHASLNGILNIF